MTPIIFQRRAQIAIGAPAIAVGGATWPNEPAGMSPWINYAWNVTNPDPTHLEWGFGEGGNGTITTDAAAPVTPSNVLQIKFPAGFDGTGQEPIKAFFNDSTPQVHLPKQLFMGASIKVSNPWQGHTSGVNKIFFVDTATALAGTTDWFYLAFFGDGSDSTIPPFHLRINTDETGVTQNHTWLTQNVNTPLFTLGVFHKIETYFQYSTTSSSFDGVIKMWLDGAQVMNYTDINFPNVGFGQQEITPVWGGSDVPPASGGQFKAQDDFYWLDHWYVSVHA